jgi:hypothetical protein
MNHKDWSSVLMRVKRMNGEDAVVVMIPAWSREQEIIIPAEHFPPLIRFHESFDDVWYRADVNPHAHSAQDLDIQNIQYAPSPIPSEELAL